MNVLQKMSPGFAMTPYQEFIHMTRYSRWLNDKNRRETWWETVQRYVDFFCEERGQDARVLNVLQNDIASAIVNMEVMPSMRTLMTAGDALRRDHTAAYNCAFLAVDAPEAFSETLHVLMNGTGVGFSCEFEDVNKLPVLPSEFIDIDETIVIRDSKGGWADGYKALIEALLLGMVPKIDYSKIRPAGAKLKTFGGRASGPEPLKHLYNYTIKMFRKFAGYKLTTVAVHDIMCSIGEIVVVGGVRRSALISLSDLNDVSMSMAKINFAVESYEVIAETELTWTIRMVMAKGQPVEPEYEVTLRKDSQSWMYEDLCNMNTIPWHAIEKQRALANNSVAYESKPSIEIFNKEWKSLIRSKSGERGMFNREAAQKQAARYGRRPAKRKYGTNPCSEIILLSKQFCNLTEAIIRENDTRKTIREKVRIATIIGTLQATLTKFKFLSEEWTKNTREEALLGVSFTGIMDNTFMAGLATVEEARNFLHNPDFNGNPRNALQDFLDEMREYAVEVNREWAAILGVNPSAAITCVKPSGTVSQLCDTASGIHARHNHHYVRTVRIDKKDPVYEMFLAAGMPMEDDMMKPHTSAVVSYAQIAPANAVTRNQMTAIEQLETWLIYQRHWCEHKPSVTISVGDAEWDVVGKWVYTNFDELSGVSFLPRSDHSYLQAPYQDKTKEELREWMEANPAPHVDWKLLSHFEKDDNTVGMQTLACVAGVCEI